MLPAQQGPGKRRLEEGDMATLSPAVVAGWRACSGAQLLRGLGTDRDRWRWAEKLLSSSLHISGFLSDPCSRGLHLDPLILYTLPLTLE